MGSDGNSASVGPGSDLGFRPRSDANGRHDVRRRQTPGISAPAFKVEAKDVKYLVMHEVRCLGDGTINHRRHPAQQWYFDTPRLNAGDCSVSPLHGQRPLRQSLHEYLNDHPEVSVTAVCVYYCTEYHYRVGDDFEHSPLPFLDEKDLSDASPFIKRLRQPGPDATPTSEYIHTLSTTLENAMRTLRQNEPKILTSWAEGWNLDAPYVNLYRSMETLKSLSESMLEPLERAYTDSLFSYIASSFDKQYQEADTLFSEGSVTAKHLQKLFQLNDIVVSLKDGQHMGYLITRCEPTPEFIQLECEHWTFDGTFRRRKETIRVEWPRHIDPNKKIPVTELPIYPLRYDQSGTKERMLKRGAAFWSCRNRRLVSYMPPRRTSQLSFTNTRYMVDIQTYKQLHGDTEMGADGDKTELEADLMDNDELPSDKFLLQLPHRILGFGLHDKKWRNLYAEYIQPVQWNKLAFDRLVLNPDKKLLIKAMVQEHVQINTSADIIEGKGNGLIILLHGGPGTGKTLTAESVAELAERPLYRVTGGDVGTEPEAIEKYLESVLYIGTTWKAVVLFDESDVFLEERTQADLKRNALVSVFLRVLEYYDGILILTSNRVGTFDEAFKSRVQLALHYPPLSEDDRRDIWLDFLGDLHEREGDTAINYTLLKRKVDLLARDPLNGRQIRNAIRTARQLASQQRQPLSYEHLKKTISVAQDFEQYVVGTHGGNTDAEYAKAQNWRAE